VIDGLGSVIEAGLELQAVDVPPLALLNENTRLTGQVGVLDGVDLIPRRRQVEVLPKNCFP